MTFGCDIRVFSSELFGGSSVKTSNPAPLHFSSYLIFMKKFAIIYYKIKTSNKTYWLNIISKLTFRALKSAASSTIPPLATLIIFTPFLHLLNTSSLIKSNKNNKTYYFKLFLT